MPISSKSSTRAALLPLRVLLVLCATNSFFSQSKELSDVDSRTFLRYALFMHEVPIATESFDDFQPVIDAKLQEALALSKARLAQIIGHRISAAGVESSSEILAYKDALKRINPRESCRLLEEMYAYSVLEGALLPPSISNPPSFPIFDGIKDEQKAAYAQDLELALWALRFVAATPNDYDKKTEACRDVLYPKYSIMHELRLRLRFTRDGVETTDLKGNPVRWMRWPLGRAREMCGRPFNAHFGDHFKKMKGPEARFHYELKKLMQLKEVTDKKTYLKKISELEEALLEGRAY